MEDVFNIKGIKEFFEFFGKCYRRSNFFLTADADLDGVSSLIIFEETLDFLKAKVKGVYFSEVEKEGYGLSKGAISFFLKHFNKKKQNILITLDYGITSFREISYAKKAGFKIAIIDHHQEVFKVPEADFIIDPNQKLDKSSFTYLANAGLSFKICCQLLKQFSKRNFKNLKNEFLVLAAIATLADKMKQVAENKKIIEKGLSFFPKTKRPGLKIFLEKKLIKYRNIPQLIKKIIVLLNTSECSHHLTDTYRLLKMKKQENIESFFRLIASKNREKQRKARDIEKKLRESILKSNRSFIFQTFKNGHSYFSSLFASKFFNDFKKPVVIVGINKKIRGSIRTPEPTNAVECLKFCREFLNTFGGHPVAAGFEVKKGKIKEFEKRIEKFFKKNKNNKLK